MAKRKPLEQLEDAVEAITTHRIPANLSTGSTLLDLAVSGEVGKAFGPGHYTLYVGDSGASTLLRRLPLPLCLIRERQPV